MISTERMSDEFVGLNTDTKPTDGVSNGSTFVEMNTGSFFIFDQESEEWLRQEAGAITPTGTKTITENGTYDVTSFATAEVNVEGGGGGGASADSLLDGTITEYSSDTLTSIRDNAFYGCAQLQTVDTPEVTSIGSSCFQSCTSLTSAIFPKATSVGSQAFYQATSINAFDLSNVEEMGDSVFNQNAMTTLSLPKMTYLPTYCIEACNNLTTLDLGAVTSLDMISINMAQSLTAVIIRTNSVASLDDVDGYGIVFQDTPIANGTGYVYVNDDLVDQYKIATNWSLIASQIKGISELPA